MNLEPTTESTAETVGSTVSAEMVSPNKYIPQFIYENLPEPLKGITDSFQGREKDIVLLSSLGVISACLPNVFGIYDSRKYNPNLSVFIIAPPASGKGVMNWSRKLIDPIHLDIIAESRRKIRQYKEAVTREGPEPKFQVKIIPGNTSSSRLYSHLESAEDSVLIFESEADSLSNMLKHDWGNFSDLLRKSFHHETVSISRQSEDRFYEIRSPKLSIVLSGTPNQVKPLIESKENGLFSRFVYYYFDDVAGWKDVSPGAQSISYDDLLDSKALDILDLYKRLNGSSTEIKMTDSQWNSFQDRLKMASDLITATNKPDFIPVVRRLALITFRIIMILTILRKQEVINGDNRVIYSTDEDVQIGLELVKILLDHSLNVFDKYEKKPINLTMAERNLYSRLPDAFRRGEGLNIALQLGYAERTFDDTLRRWERIKILQKLSHGSYGKKQLS
ncbi:MAG: DUF3987 domain-containing protein [Flavobacterium sp.]|nr:MAG: DUF3987 domain-containing protein [Flavobacterium sp.]